LCIGVFFFSLAWLARPSPEPLSPSPSFQNSSHREAGDPAKAKPYLPPDKQYLVTRNVPSRRRASAVEGYGAGGEEAVVEDGEEGGWVAPPAEGALGRLGGGGGGGGGGGDGDDDGSVPPLLDGDDDEDEGGGGATAAAPAASPVAAATPDTAEDDADDADGSIPDLDDLEIVDPADAVDDPAALPVPTAAGSAPRPTSGSGSWDRVAGGPATTTAADPAAAPPHSNDDDRHVLRTRTYDLMLTYDKYYQTPRVWLVGYDEARAPLPAAALLADVAAEHARKTVTWDAFPHGRVGGAGGRAASIHPCRHAAVMKKLASVAAGGGRGGSGGSGGGGGGGGEGSTTRASCTSSGASALPVDRYMVLFLKFIAAVIPTIEYDFTMAAATVGGPGGGGG
jgi:ubiquitin-like-conjugating enzyme ATG3